MNILKKIINRILENPILGAIAIIPILVLLFIYALIYFVGVVVKDKINIYI